MDSIFSNCLCIGVCFSVGVWFSFFVYVFMFNLMSEFDLDLFFNIGVIENGCYVLINWSSDIVMMVVFGSFDNGVNVI